MRMLTTINRITKILLLTFTVFFCFTYCNEDKNAQDSNKIIEKILSEHKDLIGVEIITISNSFFLKDFTVNTELCNSFSIDSSQNILLLKYQDLLSDSLFFERIFKRADLKYVMRQLDPAKKGAMINSEYSSNYHFSDTSYCDDFNKSYRSIRHYLSLTDKDYLILSKPIFNHKKDIATVCSSLYTEQNYLGTIYELKKNNDEWLVQNCYSMVIEFVEEGIGNDKILIYTVIKGFSGGECL